MSKEKKDKELELAKKKKAKELSKEEMKKVSGGLDMRGPGTLSEVNVTDRNDMAPQDFGTPEPLPNRPIDITRRVQGSWRPR